MHAGQGSNVNAGGIDNDLDDHSHDVNTQAGGDVATNTGSGQNTQVGDIDSSGGGAAGGTVAMAAAASSVSATTAVTVAVRPAVPAAA